MSTAPTQQIDPAKRITPVAWLMAALIAGLVVYSWRVPIDWMVERWLKPESYYSHGFLVPLVVLWLVWRDRHNLSSLRAESSALGLCVMLLGLLILLLSGWLSIFFSAMFGAILTVWGLCGFLFGRRVMFRLLFPMFVFCFMVPLPLAVIAKVSYEMKLMAARVAIAMLNLVGILAVNDGSTIYLEKGAVVTVGNACSGLRSLISLILLGILFAYLSDLSLLRRIVLFISSMPIAIVANVVRVYALCLIANRWGNEAITETIHSGSGYLIFVVAFVLLFGTAKLLGLDRSAKAAPKEVADA